MSRPLARYARQSVLPEIGTKGQEHLGKSRIACIGAGGLGSPAALYLAAAGVGTIGLVDFDAVDESNLQRQVLFRQLDAGKLKVEAAKARLQALNPDVAVEPVPVRLAAGNALEILSRYDIIVDGTDNFAAKFLINDAAVKLGLPVVYGAISRFEGRVSVFWAKHGPCYRCLYPAPPAASVMSCAEAGVLGAVAGIIGSMQACEAIKLAVSAAQGSAPAALVTLLGRLFVLDCATMASFVAQVPKAEACPVCSLAPEAIGLADLVAACPGEPPEDLMEMTAADLARAIGGAREGGPLLLDVREPSEWRETRIPGALNAPLSALQRSPDTIPEVMPGQRIVVYCQSGVRSRLAARILLDRGLSNVAHLRGGIQAWDLVRGDVSLERGALLSRRE